MKHKDNIVKLLKDGYSYDKISKELGCSKSTIHYHARKLGRILNEDGRVRHDWRAIQIYHNQDHTRTECMEKFGCSSQTWDKAVKSGRLIYTPKPKTSLDVFLIKDGDPNVRGNIKRRLINEGVLINECSECKVGPNWNGKTLIMVLDHINGVHNDHRIENLRLLCPNCNSQTETFSGRNKSYKNRIIGNFLS